MASGKQRDPENPGRRTLTEAVEWIRHAAENGYADAQYELGRASEDGQGMPRDTEEARRWYRKAADAGHAEARAALDRLSEGGEAAEGEAEAPAASENGEHTSRAADAAKGRDSADALFQRGQDFAQGRGRAADYARAAQYYRRAAEEDHAPAQIALGSLYFLGLGVLQDYVEAHFWMNLAIAQLAPGKELDEAADLRSRVDRLLTPPGLAEAQRRARQWAQQRRAEATPSLDPLALARAKAAEQL
jgi:TPR repeat protein